MAAGAAPHTPPRVQIAPRPSPVWGGRKGMGWRYYFAHGRCLSGDRGLSPMSYDTLRGLMK